MDRDLKHLSEPEASGSTAARTSREKAIMCAQIAVTHKAVDLVLLDVTGLSSFADFFVICSGKSSRQVQGIADNVESRLKEHGLRPMGVEGQREGQWVLMDYGDVIIHIFYEPVRVFYDLESLWSEAQKVRVEQHEPSSAGVS
jgi:ribosome-associated protein